jgi:hypothetical protein
LWYNGAVNEPEPIHTARIEEPPTRHWIGLRGYLARPFWGWLGGWAVLCGALASNQLRWDGELLLDLGLVLLLVELGWSNLWDLAVMTGWFRPLADGWPPKRFAPAASLPYTLPRSPGGRIARGLGRFAAWWREAFWPAAGSSLLGLLAALLLTVLLSLLLPERLRPLSAVLAALIGLGIVMRRRGRDPLAAEALVRVGLSWLAGHAVFAELGTESVVLALAFALAAWGGLRLAAGLRWSLWLLDAGQVAAVVVLIALKQPIVAGLAGLLFFGQLAMQPALRYGGGADGAGADPASIDRRANLDRRAAVSRRTWPWLMALMLLAAVALP